MISPFILINKVEIKKKNKEMVITNKGINIALSIDGDENFEILAGWWSVLHQSTDHFMIGRLIKPKIAKIDAYLSPLDLSSKALFRIINPAYIINNTNSDVNLASHTHHVPQVGLPQIEPVKSVAKVKQAPIGAQDFAMIKAKVCLKIIETNPQIAIIE